MPDTNPTDTTAQAASPNPTSNDTDKPTLAVQAGREEIAARADVDGETIFAREVRAGAWDHRHDVTAAIARHRTTHEPRPAGDLREAIREVLIAHGHRRCSAAIEGLSGVLPEIEATATEIAALATHSPAPMAGEGEARLILRALRTRMATACDWTRAGNDHVKVRTADWHVLMEIGERAKDYLAAHPSTQEG